MMNRTGYASLEYIDVYNQQPLIHKMLADDYDIGYVGLIKRPIPNTEYYDIASIYPFCVDQGAAEFHYAFEAVTSTIITDPLCDTYFYDYEKYKDHAVVKLKDYDFTKMPDNHKRNIKKYRAGSRDGFCYTEVCINPTYHAGSLQGIYPNLIKKHNITGATAYTNNQLKKLLEVPGTVLFKVFSGSQIINVSLFYIYNNNAYYHLSCQTDEGYKNQSNFTMMYDAIMFFKSLGLGYLEIGASPDGAKSNGLKRFKEGFATEIRNNYIIKRIHRPDIYEQLCYNRVDNGFFPLYRS